MTERLVLWSSVLILASASSTALAGAAFGPVFEAGDRRCEYLARGGLTSDGRTLTGVRRCDAGDGSSRTQIEVVLEEDFATRAPIPDSGTGLQPPDLPFDPVAVSGDGRVVAGARFPIGAEYFDTRGATLAFDGVATDLPLLADGPVPQEVDAFLSSFVFGTSFDASVLVGYSPDARSGGSGDRVAVRWTEGSGAEALLDSVCAPEFGCESFAHDVSDDGRVIVGSVTGTGAFRWTEEDGPQTLPMGGAEAISPNGRFVVGYGDVEGVSQPVRWSEATGPIGLGTRGGRWSWPTAVSNAGDRVVGGRSLFEFSRDVAEIWTPEHGLESVRDHLERLGHATWPWRVFDGAVDLSGDGETLLLTGRGYDRLAPRELLHARLVPRRRGVDLCDEGLARCIVADVLARSNLLAPSPLNDEVGFRHAWDSVAGASINRGGEVLFSGSVFSPFDRLDGYDYTTGAAFGPDASGGVEYRFELGAFVSDDPDFGDGGLSLRSTPSLGIAKDGSVFMAGYGFGDDMADWVIVAEAPGESRSRLVVPTKLDASTGSVLTLSSVDWDDPFTLRQDGSVGGEFVVVEADGARRTVVASVSPSGEATVHAELGGGHPALEAGETLGGVSVLRGHVAGRLAFTTRLRRDGDWAAESALWLVDGRNRLHLVARDDRPFDFFGESRRFRSFDGGIVDLVVSRRNRLTFYARAWAEDPALGSEGVLWRWSRRGGLVPRLLERDLEATLADDVRYVSIASLRGNRRDEVLIEALVDPPIGLGRHGNAFWLLDRRNRLVSLLRSGDPAPGLPAGVVLGAGNWNENDWQNRGRLSALTRRGDALLEFALVGPGFDPEVDRALYLVTRRGRPQLLLRTGHRIEVAHGDVQTVEGFSVAWGRSADEGRQPVNDRRQVAVTATLSNGESAILRLDARRARARKARRDEK